MRCKDNHGRQFLVEMQMNWTTAFKQRVLFNASRAYVTQSEKGIEFRSLKPVYALNLINATYLPQSPDYYHHYAVVHLKDSNERLEGLEFVFIELEKFKAKNLTERKLQVLWLRFMTEINENTQQIPAELMEQPEIQKALTYVMEASLSKAEQHLYEKNWDRISSEKTLLLSAEASGEARGIVKGRAEGKLEIARGMKKDNMPVEVIIKYTGLSREEIEKL